MSTDDTEYFGAPLDAGWRWTSSRSAIVHRESAPVEDRIGERGEVTIALRDELMILLDSLIEPNGWPLFADLVWLFAAWRRSDENSAIDQLDSEEAELVRGWKGAADDRWLDCGNVRAVVAALPKTVPSAVAHQVYPTIVSGQFTAEAATLVTTPSPDLLAIIRKVDARKNSEHSSRDAALLGRRVQRIVLRLGEAPERRWLPGLVASLLPLAELPGPWDPGGSVEPTGAGDLRTRGRLDRLLITELAHDPDVLASRIAQNEALYSEPPATRERRPVPRSVLVDTGLRQWGRPRRIAIAAALALVATSRFGATIATADLDRPVQVVVHSQLSEKTIASLLEHVDEQLDLRGRLDSFAEQTPMDHEIVLVTSLAAWRDTRFERALEVLEARRVFAITVHETGALALWHSPPSRHAETRARPRQLLRERSIRLRDDSKSDVAREMGRPNAESDCDLGRLVANDGSVFRIDAIGDLTRERPRRAPTPIASDVATRPVIWMSQRGDALTIVCQPHPQRIQWVELAPSGRTDGSWIADHPIAAVEDLGSSLAIFESGPRPRVHLIPRDGSARPGELDAVFPAKLADVSPYPQPRLFYDEHDRLCYWTQGAGCPCPRSIHSGSTESSPSARATRSRPERREP